MYWAVQALLPNLFLFGPLWDLIECNMRLQGHCNILSAPIKRTGKDEWNIYNPECHPQKKSARHPLWVISLFIALGSGWEKQLLSDSLHSEAWVFAWVIAKYFIGVTHLALWSYFVTVLGCGPQGRLGVHLRKGGHIRHPTYTIIRLSRTARV